MEMNTHGMTFVNDLQITRMLNIQKPPLPNNQRKFLESNYKFLVNKLNCAPALPKGQCEGIWLYHLQSLGFSQGRPRHPRPQLSEQSIFIQSHAPPAILLYALLALTTV